MLRNTYTKWLWDNRRSLPVWAVAVAGVAALYGTLWPSIDSASMQQAIHTLPQAVLDAVGYGGQLTPAGYLTAQVYGLVDAAILLVFAISAGARLVAGEESSGQLEILMSAPVGRARFSLERFAALVTALVAINVVLALTLVVVAKATDLEGVGIGGFAAMGVQMTAFAILFGGLAFATGAATGSHSAAVAVSAGAAVGAFVANGVLPQVSGLEWTQHLSAFHWLTGNGPLIQGVDLGSVGLFVALTGAIVAGGIWLFTRRDLHG